MDEKVTAVYLMVRRNELLPEDRGSYERPLAEQKAACLQFIEERTGASDSWEPVAFYHKRGDLLLDIERERVKRVIVQDKNRLAATPEELEGILFELRMAGVELVAVTE
ncbi:MAG: recombinase family protein [Thermodesulfobacteriota bacterium]|nr:recombinase family protein [Thermodesulfobacteriota bacterium]